MVSIDGEMQGSGAVYEDGRGGLERGGWAMLLADREVEERTRSTSAPTPSCSGRWT